MPRASVVSVPMAIENVVMAEGMTTSTFSGGASLSGDVDLAGSPPAGVTVTTITGAAATALGSAVAVGDLNGDGSPDLLAGTALAAPGGKLRAGAAYARFGPITSNLDFGQAVGSGSGPSAVWLGQNRTDGLGIAVAIGNVTGTTQGEAVIGGLQIQRTGGVQGGVDGCE